LIASHKKAVKIASCLERAQRTAARFVYIDCVQQKKQF